MALNVADLISPIVTAVKPILATHWGEAESFAQTEATKIAHTLANIADLYATQKIDQGQASALLDMQKQASQSVLLTIEGIGLVAAQNAINAGLKAISGVVNGALGFALL